MHVCPEICSSPPLLPLISCCWSFSRRQWDSMCVCVCVREAGDFGAARISLIDNEESVMERGQRDKGGEGNQSNGFSVWLENNKESSIIILHLDSCTQPLSAHPTCWCDRQDVVHSLTQQRLTTGSPSLPASFCLSVQTFARLLGKRSGRNCQLISQDDDFVHFRSFLLVVPLLR